MTAVAAHKRCHVSSCMEHGIYRAIGCELISRNSKEEYAQQLLVQSKVFKEGASA